MESLLLININERAVVEYEKEKIHNWLGVKTFFRTFAGGKQGRDPLLPALSTY